MIVKGLDCRQKLESYTEKLNQLAVRHRGFKILGL